MMSNSNIRELVRRCSTVGKLVTFFASTNVKRVMSVILLYAFCVSGYFIFISNNYDLFWSYLIFPFSLWLFLNINTKKEYIPWKERLMKTSTLLRLINLFLVLLLFVVRYNIYHSQVYLERGEYEFSNESPYYTIYHLESRPWYKNIFNYEDITTTFERLRNLPTESVTPEFGEALLQDLSIIEGQSLGFLRAFNHVKLRLLEGKPVEIGLCSVEGVSPSNKGNSALNILVFPNDIAFVLISIPGEDMRYFPLELSEESLVYFREMFE